MLKILYNLDQMAIIIVGMLKISVQHTAIITVMYNDNHNKYMQRNP
jgi:hypothetical protein